MATFEVTPAFQTLCGTYAVSVAPSAGGKVRWRQANSNWFVVDEEDQEVYASAIRDEHGLWQTKGRNLYDEGTFWSENAARLSIQQEMEGVEFVDAVEQERR